MQTRNFQRLNLGLIDRHGKPKSLKPKIMLEGIKGIRGMKLPSPFPQSEIIQASTIFIMNFFTTSPVPLQSVDWQRLHKSMIGAPTCKRSQRGCAIVARGNSKIQPDNRLYYNHPQQSLRIWNDAGKMFTCLSLQLFIAIFFGDMIFLSYNEALFM